MQYTVRNVLYEEQTLASQTETTPYAGWQLAARKMVGDACLEEYMKANEGKKKHVPYKVPDWCAPMLKAVEEDREEDCRAMMHAVRIGALSLIP